MERRLANDDIVTSPRRAGARAHLRAMGLDERDWSRLDVELTEAELAARLAEWGPPSPRVTHGVLAKHARSVASALRGAVTR